MSGSKLGRSVTAWDNSASVEQVPDSYVFHPAMAEYGSVPGMGERIFRQAEDEEEPDPLTVLNGSVESEVEEVWDYYSGTNDLPVEPEDDNEEIDDHLIATEEEIPYDDGSWDDDDGDLFEATVAATSPLKPQRSISPIHVNRCTGSVPRQSALPFHLLHTNEFDITLFHRKDHFRKSRVVCKNALHQTIPPRLYGLTSFERMNMIQQIPSLGIVAIASQVGRVALLTMTKMKTSPIATSPVLGFRIEYILPFKSQEDKRERPDAPLMGMAVGPVQGHGIESEPAELRATDGTEKLDGRRYRLLMIYYDHTVLSYEIGRGKGRTGYEVNDRVLLI